MLKTYQITIRKQRIKKKLHPPGRHKGPANYYETGLFGPNFNMMHDHSNYVNTVSDTFPVRNISQHIGTLFSNTFVQRL